MKFGKTLMVVLWPSFLMATASVGVIFSLLDPSDLVIHGIHTPEDPLAVYAFGFAAFWILCALSSFMTHVLSCKGEFPEPDPT